MLEKFMYYWQKVNEVIDGINFGFICEIIVNLVILSILFRILDVAEDKMKKQALTANPNSQIVKLIRPINRILKFIIFFIILASFLQTHGYSVSSLIAGFGITGLAVGFAANSALANIFGTISIYSDKSFQIGDYIKSGEYEGTVEDINLRSTKIRTLDNALTIIPNSLVANGAVINVTAAHRRRIFEIIGVTYDTSNENLTKAVKIIEEILESRKDISKDYIVNIDKLDNSSINIRVSAYVKTKQLGTYLKTKEAFILEVVRQFREANIEFAFPTQTIYLAGNSDEN